jgi:Uma2 family endonuclease
METLDKIAELSARTELKFEYIHGEIVPKEDQKPLSDELINYILSDEFDLQKLLTIYDMPKTSYNHKKIIAQLKHIIAAQINLELHEYYLGDLEIKAKFLGTFYIPDLAFTLVRDEIYDENGALENPISIIEVLSPATEKKDRNEKKKDYQNIESLQEYVLIAQDSYKIEQFLRKGKTSWITKVYDSAEQTCILTVGVKIKLSELYKHANFDLK